MDISLEIMRVNTQEMEKGDIVDAWASSHVAAWDEVDQEYHIVGGVNTPRTGYVHITGVPISVVQKAKKLLVPEWNPPTNEVDPHSGGIKYERKWRALVESLPAAIKSRWLAERELTFSWTQVRNYVQNKVTQNNLNPQDLE